MRAPVVVCTMALLTMAPATRARQTLELSTMEMLDLYEHRREMAVAGLGDHLHIDSIFDDLTREGKKWVNAAGKKEAARRRLVMTTFVLEVLDRLAADAGTGQTRDRLVIWARQQLVDAGPPSPSEYLWHLALVALIERRGVARMDVELEFVRDRFPNDARFDLVWAWQDCNTHRPAAGMLGYSKLALDHLWNAWDIPFFEYAETFYAKALANPASAAEARVRIAEMRLKSGHPDEALAILQEADRMSHDRDIRYWSALEQGWAFQLKQDRARAIDAFRRALAYLPGAQTASIALSANLLVDGQREEASEITEAALRSGVVDPWLFHRTPEYRLFPQWMTMLREQLK